jgi:hypothetical protein
MNDRVGLIAKVAPPSPTCPDNQVEDRLARVDGLSSLIAGRISDVYERLEPVLLVLPTKENTVKVDQPYCPLAGQLDAIGDVLSHQLARLNALYESIRL